MGSAFQSLHPRTLKEYSVYNGSQDLPPFNPHPQLDPRNTASPSKPSTNRTNFQPWLKDAIKEEQRLPANHIPLSQWHSDVPSPTSYPQPAVPPLFLMGSFIPHVTLHPQFRTRGDSRSPWIQYLIHGPNQFRFITTRHQKQLVAARGGQAGSPWT